MVQTIRSRIAKFLAIQLVAVMMGSTTQAEGLKLPQDGAEPVTLSVSETELAKRSAQEVLRVYIGDAEQCCEDRTPVAGRYAQTNDTLTFTPAFGFEAGQDYVARVQLPGMEERLSPFAIASSTPQLEAVVTDIFPSGDILAENVLRFYIHFSVPMKPHVAFDYIKLRDASGKADDAAFMRFKQELWNEDRTRLTVLIDPGRIKREVATNVELGPALVAGGRYTLSVEGGWPTIDGKNTLSPIVREFAVTDALRRRPDAKFWTANSPCIGTQEPLNIQFDRPFDRHLLNRAVHLIKEDGHSLDGVMTIGVDERSLSFTPKERWANQILHVVADATLEDIAANNFQDLLDHVEDDETFEAPSTVLPIYIQSCYSQEPPKL